MTSSRKNTLILLAVLLSVPAFYLLYATRGLCTSALHEEPLAAQKASLNFEGENILYTVKLGKVVIGKATFRSMGSTVLNRQNVNLMTFHTQTTGFRDTESIYSDPLTFLPLRVERDIRIGLRGEKITEEYDQKNFVLTVTKQGEGDGWGATFRKEGPIHNAVMLPFYVRTIPELPLGWNFTAELAQRRFLIKLVSVENVTVPAGTFEAYHFESEPRKFEIWITRDDLRIPVKIIGTSGIGYAMVMKQYATAAAVSEEAGE